MTWDITVLPSYTVLVKTLLEINYKLKTILRTRDVKCGSMFFAVNAQLYLRTVFPT